MAQREDEWKRALAAGLAEAGASVPLTLLRHYKAMGLNETEAMLLVHLLAFVRHEHNGFPTIEDIADRMSIGSQSVAELLGKLMKLGLLGIDQGYDEADGVTYERYNLQPLFLSLADRLLEERRSEGAAATAASASKGKGGGVARGGISGGDIHARDVKDSLPDDRPDIYTIFEREFARPLTPMELETITGWLEQDRYNEELILTALKESVFTGKLNFRYIDRILLEWHRNRVQTVEQARVYSQRFRGMR